MDAQTHLTIRDRIDADDLLDCQRALDHATRCIAAIRGMLADSLLDTDDTIECIEQALRDYDGDEDD